MLLPTTVKISVPLLAISRLGPWYSWAPFVSRNVARCFVGDVGDCGAGSEKMRDPAAGREIQGAVYPMTLGILDIAQV